MDLHLDDHPPSLTPTSETFSFAKATSTNQQKELGSSPDVEETSPSVGEEEGEEEGDPSQEDHEVLLRKLSKLTANAYAPYFNLENLLEYKLKPMEDSIENVLTRLEESSSVFSQVSGEGAKFKQEVIPSIDASVKYLQLLYPLIDTLHQVVNRIGKNVVDLDERFQQTEKAYMAVRRAKGLTPIGWIGDKRNEMPTWKDFNIINTAAVFTKIKEDQIQIVKKKEEEKLELPNSPPESSSDDESSYDQT